MVSILLGWGFSQLGKMGKTLQYSTAEYFHLLPIGSEEREVLGVGSIPVAILPSCQDMKTIAL